MKQLRGRTLVISDVHGNLAALETVLEIPHDHVVCLGDTVGRGPQSTECLARLRRHDAMVILGNHEFAALQAENETKSSARAFAPPNVDREVASTSLSAEALDYLNGLPRWLRIGFEFGTCLCVHGSPRSVFGRGMDPDIAAWRGQLATSVPVEAVFVGHTHIPYDLMVDGTRIVNPGSVGLPQDGDPRAAYAVIDHTAIELGRVAYPVEKTIAAIKQINTTGESTQLLIASIERGVRFSQAHSGGTCSHPAQPLSADAQAG